MFTVLLVLYSGLLSAHPESDSDRLVITDEKGDWGQLAPFLHVQKGPGYVYTSFIFDTLVWKDKSGALVPLLASEWQHEKNQPCYSFTLNPAATWHDGKPVLPSDVVFTFQYMKAHFYPFVDLSDVNQVSVTGDHQVSVCTKKDDPFFVARVAGTLPVLPEHIYHAVDDPKHYTQPDAVVGSGPYRLKKYRKAQGFYLLERNDHWYRGRPAYKEVVITRLSPQAAANAMKKGQADIAGISFDFIDLFQQSGARIIQAPSNHPYRLVFNHQHRFNKVVLRQGLAYLLNRPQLMSLAYRGYAKVARPAFKQDGCNTGLALYRHDAAKAAALLRQGGWTKDDDGRWVDEQGEQINLSLIAPANAVLLSKVLAKQLTKSGFEVTLRLLQGPVFTDRFSHRTFDLALTSQSHQGDLDRFRMMLTGRQMAGDRYFSDPELTQLLNAIRYQTDPEVRARQFARAEAIYNAQLPSFPLVNPLLFSAVAPGIPASFTPNGLAMGIPMILNKLSLLVPEKSL